MVVILSEAKDLFSGLSKREMTSRSAVELLFFAPLRMTSNTHARRDDQPFGC
jgi:hypothetical protein